VYLSKYLSTCSTYSRRKATEAIKSGLVTVNDVVIKNPAYIIKSKDEICVNGQIIRQLKKFIYILFNKPENCITTASDEHGRRTVLDLIKIKTDIRLYPVGRLDRMTTGLLLLTNDGELTKKLTHPSHNVTKKYSVEINIPFSKNDLIKLSHGIWLKDGFIKPDSIYFYKHGNGKRIIIELHSGKNRIIRRIFEHFGHKVVKLDRFYYAGLTTKQLNIGKWRHLSSKEINMLKNY
jgi:23S rRNA pseudouridine2605 synthase